VKDRAAALAILDEGLICYVGFFVDDRPWVIPTMYAREGDVLFLHGSPASRMLRGLAGGIDVSVTITLLDGLVLARTLPVWAGEIPVSLAFGTPRADELAANSALPSSVVAQTAKGVRG
jgi:hypothetical protein